MPIVEKRPNPVQGLCILYRAILDIGERWIILRGRISREERRKFSRKCTLVVKRLSMKRV